MKKTNNLMVRKASDRGTTELDWLHSRHSFSFGGYQDPEHMEFGTLRVINDDRVEPGKGFGTHPHHNMEIISYVVEGKLEHRDSMGNGSVIIPGDVQRMSAGSGVTHSEYNPQSDEKVHFLQIWIQPHEKNIKPSYEQKSFRKEEKTNALRLVVSPEGMDGSLTIHQDVWMYAALLEPQAVIRKSFDSDRKCWIQVIRGKLSINDEILEEGDGAALKHGAELMFRGIAPSEFLVFDLA